MDINIFACTKRLNNLMKRDDVKLPMREINECGTVNDLTILLCNDKEIHRFACGDKFNRDKWVKKVNKLVDKRAQRLQNINNGSLGINSPKLKDSHSSSKAHPHTVHKNSRASLHQLSKIKEVEAEFD